MELKGNEQMVEAFRRGDRDVLTDLYRAHVEEIRRLLQRGFSFSSKGESVRFRGFTEPFRVQEVLQEVFVHAFREKARQSYDSTQPYLPYLITIARNWVIDRYRKERTESALFVRVGELVTDDESPEEAIDRWASHDAQVTPELAAYQGQLSETLKEFVTGLDEDEAILLNEHLMGDLTQHEIAERLKTDRNDVRKRIRLMRERLLRHLKREGFIGSLDPSEVFGGE